MHSQILMNVSRLLLEELYCYQTAVDSYINSVFFPPGSNEGWWLGRKVIMGELRIYGCFQVPPAMVCKMETDNAISVNP